MCHSSRKEPPGVTVVMYGGQKYIWNCDPWEGALCKLVFVLCGCSLRRGSASSQSSASSASTVSSSGSSIKARRSSIGTLHALPPGNQPPPPAQAHMLSRRATSPGKLWTQYQSNTCTLQSQHAPCSHTRTVTDYIR